MGIGLRRSGLYVPTPFRVSMANTGLILQKVSEERMPDDGGGANHPGIFAPRVRKRLRTKVLRSFRDANVRKSMKTKGSSLLGSDHGRIAADRKGEAVINETNSSVEQKERGIRFIFRELRWRLQLRANRAAVRTHSLPVISAVMHYHGEFAKTSRRRFLASTVSNASYAK